MYKALSFHFNFFLNLKPLFSKTVEVAGEMPWCLRVFVILVKDVSQHLHSGTQLFVTPVLGPVTSEL